MTVLDSKIQSALQKTPFDLEQESNEKPRRSLDEKPKTYSTGFRFGIAIPSLLIFVYSIYMMAAYRFGSIIGTVAIFSFTALFLVALTYSSILGRALGFKKAIIGIFVYILLIFFVSLRTELSPYLHLIKLKSEFAKVPASVQDQSDRCTDLVCEIEDSASSFNCFNFGVAAMRLSGSNICFPKVFNKKLDEKKSLSLTIPDLTFDCIASRLKETSAVISIIREFGQMAKKAHERKVILGASLEKVKIISIKSDPFQLSITDYSSALPFESIGLPIKVALPKNLAPEFAAMSLVDAACTIITFIPAILSLVFPSSGSTSLIKVVRSNVLTEASDAWTIGTIILDALLSLGTTTKFDYSGEISVQTLKTALNSVSWLQFDSSELSKIIEYLMFLLEKDPAKRLEGLNHILE